MSRPMIEQRMYFPAGCDPDDSNAYAFMVGVFWRGQGKYMVARDQRGYQQMTHTGKWLWCPQKFQQMRWCRFDFETACQLAEKHVDAVSVNGGTWAQWERRREAAI